MTDQPQTTPEALRKAEMRVRMYEKSIAMREAEIVLMDSYIDPIRRALTDARAVLVELQNV